MVKSFETSIRSHQNEIENVSLEFCIGDIFLFFVKKEIVGKSVFATTNLFTARS